MESSPKKNESPGLAWSLMLALLIVMCVLGTLGLGGAAAAYLFDALWGGVR